MPFRVKQGQAEIWFIWCRFVLLLNQTQDASFLPWMFQSRRDVAFSVYSFERLERYLFSWLSLIGLTFVCLLV